MTKIRPRAPKLASQMANNIEMRRLDYWKFAEMSDCMFLLLDKLKLSFAWCPKPYQA